MAENQDPDYNDLKFDDIGTLSVASDSPRELVFFHEEALAAQKRANATFKKSSITGVRAGVGTCRG
jgi:hypothetical protein